MPAEYAVRGTYSDGVQRHHHVDTEDPVAYVARLLTGFLPFAQVEIEPCGHGFIDCPGHSWDTPGQTTIVTREETR